MMDDQLWKASLEAQFLIGHCVPCGHLAFDRTTITNWSWDVDDVRQHLHVSLNAIWDQRILELEMQGLARFSFYAAPVTWDKQDHAYEIPGWQDQPREQWGSLDIHPRGVLRLAELYGRPYVKLEESPALLAHWQLVQAESEARLHTPHDEARWAREWPERAVLRRAWEAEYWRKLEAGEGESGCQE